MAVILSQVPGRPAAAATGAGDGTLSLVQGGEKTRGFYVRMDARGTSWTVTVRPLDQRGTKTYPLAPDVRLAYRGEFIPWQSGVTPAAVVELLLNQGEVKVINILAPSS
jgi:hypothetical protein